MSFLKFSTEDIHAVAEAYAVDVDADANRADVIEELKANGVEWADYKKGVLSGAIAPVNDVLEVPATEATQRTEESVREEEPVPTAVPIVEEPVAEEPEEVEAVRKTKHLVKMKRRNFSYQVRGYKFTRDHPFALVDEDDLDFLLEEIGGFVLASPKEVKGYYS